MKRYYLHEKRSTAHAPSLGAHSASEILLHTPCMQRSRSRVVMSRNHTGSGMMYTVIACTAARKCIGTWCGAGKITIRHGDADFSLDLLYVAGFPLDRPVICWSKRSRGRAHVISRNCFDFFSGMQILWWEEVWGISCWWIWMIRVVGAFALRTNSYCAYC